MIVGRGFANFLLGVMIGVAGAVTYQRLKERGVIDPEKLQSEIEDRLHRLESKAKKAADDVEETVKRLVT